MYGANLETVSMDLRLDMSGGNLGKPLIHALEFARVMHVLGAELERLTLTLTLIGSILATLVKTPFSIYLQSEVIRFEYIPTQDRLLHGFQRGFGFESQDHDLYTALVKVIRLEIID